MRDLNRLVSVILIPAFLLQFAITVPANDAGPGRFSSAAGSGFRGTFSLAIMVMEGGVTPVPDAVVTVWKDNFGDLLKYDYQERTDKNGRAEFKITSNDPSPKIHIKTYKGYLKGEETITLTSTSMAHAISIEGPPFTIFVTDAKGQRVGGALVNIGGSYTPESQHETDSEGRVQLKVFSYKPLKVKVEATKGDSSGEAYIDSSIETEKFIALKPIDNDLFGADRKDLIDLRFKVFEKIDGSTRPVDGARITFRNTQSGRVYAEVATTSDGSAGRYVIADDYLVEVHKDGYEPASTFVQLTTSQRRTTVRTPINLKRTAFTPSKTDVLVRVQNTLDKNFVGDVRVVLAGRFGDSKRVYEGYTDRQSGLARIPVENSGRFDLEISQDNFETVTKTVTVALGSPEVDLGTFMLIEKKKPALSEMVYVRVLAGDRNRAAIRGASVKVGNIAVTTDENGRATIATAFGIETGVVVTASANGYKSKTQTVPVTRGVDYANADARATIVLDAGEDPVSEDTALALIVEVRDRANLPVPDADVVFHSSTGMFLSEKPTNAAGESEFSSTDSDRVPLSAQRQGITVDVSKFGYQKIINRSVPSNLLAPSNTKGRYIIELGPDWTSLTAALAKFEPRVLAFNAESTEPSSSTVIAVNAAAQKMAEIERSVNGLIREIDSFGGTMYTSSGLNGQKRCVVVDELKQKIEGYEADVKGKEAELNRLIRTADQEAASCSTAADGALIKTNYRSGIGLLGQIGAIEKLAVADSNELLRMSNEAEVQKGFLKDVEDRVAKLGLEARRAEAASQSAVRQYDAGIALINGLSGRRGALRSEFDLLKKTYDVDQSLAILPPDLKQRITLISDILSVTASDSSNGKLQEAAGQVAKLVQTSIDIQSAKGTAERKLAGFKAEMCQVDPMRSSVERIGTLLTNATFDIGAAADLPRKADSCVNRAACQPLTGELRAAINGNDTGRAEALIVRMNGMGCDTSAFKAELEAKNERDAANLIDQSKQNCRFQQAADLAAQIPESIRSKPRVSRAITEVQAGLQAQHRIEDLIDKADATSSLSDARSFIDEARRVAAPFPCLAESIKDKNATVKQSAVEEIPEDSAPRTAGNDKRPVDRVRKPAVEEIPEDSAPRTAGNDRRPVAPVSKSEVEDIPDDSPVRPTPEKPSNAKPKNNGPDFFEKLGKVVADTATDIQNEQNPPGPTPVPRPPAAGDLTLVDTWVRPHDHSACCGGEYDYSFSPTTATRRDIMPPAEGGNLTLEWTFNGVPGGSLTPGQEVTIGISGTFTTALAPRDLQPPASASVRVYGLGLSGEKEFQQQNAYISKTQKRDGLYVFKVPMNATSITIELNADYGISTFAKYRYELKK
ncbi:MAG: hypothetical protein QOE77_1885 [Blastocatellia bacterium]|jgi:hypothetical protein|nr:hypothetical protein [Blastocatellia bacterium]